MRTEPVVVYHPLLLLQRAFHRARNLDKNLNSGAKCSFAIELRRVSGIRIPN